MSNPMFGPGAYKNINRSTDQVAAPLSPSASDIIPRVNVTMSSLFTFGTPAPALASGLFARSSTPVVPTTSSGPALNTDASDGAQPADAAIRQVKSEASLFAPVQPNPTSLFAPGSTSAPASNMSQPVVAGISSGVDLSGALGSTFGRTPTAQVKLSQSIDTANANAMNANNQRRISANNLESNQLSTFVPNTRALVRRNRPNWLQTQLLTGPGTRIVVGPGPALPSTESLSTMWCLPKAFISHFSLALRDACSRPAPKDQDSRITLPDEDPDIFRLFVEWMYSGIYTLGSQIPSTDTRSANLDAQAWVLGDVLRSPQFKNYAMIRLFESVLCATPKQIKPRDIQYACTNSVIGSKLRQFLLEYLTTHFANSFRVEGTTEEWSQILLQHADARSFLLTGLRMGSDQRQTIQDKKAYLEPEQEEETGQHSARGELKVVPTKRDADGMPVKIENAEA